MWESRPTRRNYISQGAPRPRGLLGRAGGASSCCVVFSGGGERSRAAGRDPHGEPGAAGREPAARSGLPSRRVSQHERGDGPQRGEPQHPRHEQPRHLALLRAGDWPAARGPPQHPLLQRPRGLDTHQPHPQHEYVHLPAHREGDALRDAGPGQSPLAHALGADGLRGAVHGVAQVPDHHAHRAVFPHQLLHEIRPDTLHHQHHLPHERLDPQAAPAPRSPDLWDQQVLSPPDEASRGGRGNPVVVLLLPSPPPGIDLPDGCLKAVANRLVYCRQDPGAQ